MGAKSTTQKRVEMPCLKKFVPFNVKGLILPLFFNTSVEFHQLTTQSIETHLSEESFLTLSANSNFVAEFVAPFHADGGVDLTPTSVGVPHPLDLCHLLGLPPFGQSCHRNIWKDFARETNFTYLCLERTT